MSFSKARYVTVCQQMLVSVSVLMLAVTAAGALNLDIVSPDAGGVPGRVATGTQGVHGVPGSPSRAAAGTRSASAPAHRPEGAGTTAEAAVTDAAPVRGEVATRPVAPTVKQVPLTPRTKATAPRLERKTTARAPRVAAGAATGETGSDAGSIAGLPIVLTSPAEVVHGFATVGAVWDHGVEIAENAIVFEVRTELNGTWSAWQRLEYHDDHAPDGSEAASTRDRPGTEPAVVGNVDRVQLRVAAAAGRPPQGLEFSLIDPGATTLSEGTAAIDTARISAADATTRGTPIESTANLPQASARSTGDIELSAMKVSPKPQIFSRAQWGADEKLREKGLPDYGTIKTGFVHHTVNANNYSKADVPAIIRSIYAYHVVSRGWRDIGYNFLVDRFGRIWEGRYGGVDKAVVGAHTLGFNDVSFAMSAIGNFDIAKPPQAVIDAYAKLFAWKLSLYNIPANATGLRINGKTLRAINGHRDVGQTACPGKYLYARLPDIRAAAAKIQAAAQGYQPNQAPTAAGAQSASVRPGGVRNLLGRTGRADIAMVNGDGNLAVLPLGAMVGFHGRVTSRGSWRGAIPVGDITGDRLGDVLTPVPKGRGWLMHAGAARGAVSAGTVGRPVLRAAVQVIPVGDWNNDGRTDVLAVTKTKMLVLYRGTGAGHFARGIVLARHWNYVRTVAGGDLDGNGRPELLVQDSAHRRFRVPSLAANRLGARIPVRIPRGYTAFFGGGDMTGDGRADVWVRTSDGRAYVLTGNGRGAFSTRLGPFAGFETLRPLGLAAMASGPRLDVVSMDTKGALVVRTNNDQVNAGAIISARKVAGTPTQVLTVGDWNRDGRGDVVVRIDGGKHLDLYRGDGRGQFATRIRMPGDWTGVSNLTAVGDITGDGRPDLVGRNSSGVLVVFPGNGSTGFNRPQRLPTQARTANLVGGATWATGSFPGSVALSSDTSFVPLGASTGARAIAQGSGSSLTAYNWVIGVGDVNGDGRPDLLVRQRTSGSLWLIPGRAVGVGPRALVTTGLLGYRLGG